jgi:hypothetical protein
MSRARRVRHACFDRPWEKPIIIDRREVGEVGAFAHVTDEQLMQEAEKRARQLGLAGPRLVKDEDAYDEI